MMKPHTVGLEISRLSHKFHRTLHAGHADSFPEGITGTNIRIIRFLAAHSEQDIFQKDLEEQFSVRRSTVSKVLALMEDKGLILRQSVASDARLKKLVLTPRGWEIYRITTDTAIATEAQLVAGFSEKELTVLGDMLQRMNQNLDAWNIDPEGGSF